MATVELSDATQLLLHEQMERGRFATVDEVVRTALEALAAETTGPDYEDLDEETRAAIEAAEASMDAGLARPWSEVREELLAKYCNRPGQP